MAMAPANNLESRSIVADSLRGDVLQVAGSSARGHERRGSHSSRLNSRAVGIAPRAKLPGIEPVPTFPLVAGVSKLPRP